MTDPATQRITAFFMSQRADRMADYLSRGRNHRALSNDEVCAKWVDAYRAWAADTSNREALSIESDLEAELDLRGIDLPLDLVQDEFRNVAKDFADEFSDPETRERIGMELLEEIEAHERSAN